jgi:ankyrin repeat protein
MGEGGIYILNYKMSRLERTAQQEAKLQEQQEKLKKSLYQICESGTSADLMKLYNTDNSIYSAELILYEPSVVLSAIDRCLERRYDERNKMIKYIISLDGCLKAYRFGSEVHRNNNREHGIRANLNIRIFQKILSNGIKGFEILEFMIISMIEEEIAYRDKIINKIQDWLKSPPPPESSCITEPKRFLGSCEYVLKWFELQDACERGDVDSVQPLLYDWLLAYRDDNTIASGNFYLLRASYNGHLPVVELLIREGGANPAASQNAALSNASMKGHVEIVRYLLTFKDRGVKTTDFMLLRASIGGHLEVVKVLAENGADPKADSNEALIMASHYGRLNVVQWLVEEKNVNPSVREFEAFKMASRYGNFEVLKWLAGRPEGGNINNWGNSAVVDASHYGKFDVVKWLVDVKGVDANQLDNRAIIGALQNNHLDIVRWLGDKVNPSLPNNELIIEASERGYLAIVKWLVDVKGVHPAAPNNEAIIAASKWNHLPVVEYLLSLGKDNNSVNPGAQDNEAIIEASHRGHIDIVICLLKSGRIIPWAQENEAIKRAYLWNRVDVFILLSKVPNIERDFVQNGLLNDEFITPYNERREGKKRLELLLRFIEENYKKPEFIDLITVILQTKFKEKVTFTRFWNYALQNKMIKIGGKNMNMVTELESEDTELLRDGAFRIDDLPLTPVQKQWAHDIENNQIDTTVALHQGVSSRYPDGFPIVSRLLKFLGLWRGGPRDRSITNSMTNIMKGKTTTEVPYVILNPYNLLDLEPIPLSPPASPNKKKQKTCDTCKDKVVNNP